MDRRGGEGSRMESGGGSDVCRKEKSGQRVVA